MSSSACLCHEYHIGTVGNKNDTIASEAFISIDMQNGTHRKNQTTVKVNHRVQ